MQDNMQENTFICACNSYRKGFRESLKGTFGSAVDFQCSTEIFFDKASKGGHFYS